MIYKKSETVRRIHGNAPVDVVWLELRNNTKWRIWHVGLKDEFGGSGWCYSVVTDDACHTSVFPSLGNCGDVGGVINVGPGQSVPIVVSPSISAEALH